MIRPPRPEAAAFDMPADPLPCTERAEPVVARRKMTDVTSTEWEAQTAD
ncbi:hypothetical protein AB0H88_36305 [Nonomuraea sp. NPDC050680]